MAELRSRAQRFLLHVPIRYREIGGTTWFDGKTENISRTGVLFSAEHLLKPNATVELSLSLPARIIDDRPAKIFCRAEVIRTVRGSTKGVPSVAAAIRSYRFARRYDARLQTERAEDG